MDFHGLTRRGILEALAGTLPTGAGGRRIMIAPTLEGGAENDRRANAQEIKAGSARPRSKEQERARRDRDDAQAENDRPQHHPPAFSSTTAVPYATISLMVCPISAESNRIMTIALACMREAFLTIRSTAWRRASSRSCVYSVISPPASERSPAMMLPPRPRLRTTTPNTWPLTSLTRKPATFSVVTTSMASAPLRVWPTGRRRELYPAR